MEDRVKTMKFPAAAAAFLVAGLVGGTGNEAKADFIGTIKRLDCPGMFGASLDQCSYDGAPAIMKIFEDGTVEVNTALFPSFTGTEIVVNAVNRTTGSWTYTPGVGGPLVTAFTTRGGGRFNLFINSGDPEAGEWFTPLNKDDVPTWMQYLVFFGTPAPSVPETTAPPVPVPAPAALAVLGTGLLALFAVARRRSRKPSGA